MRSIVWSLITILIKATFIQQVSSSDSSYSSDRSSSSQLTEGDELILTGSDGGCWEDDECQAYPPAESGSGSDDLITPRIVVLNPRPSLSPVLGMRTSTLRSTCVDDEDCNLYEGSGYDSGPGMGQTGERAGKRPNHPYDSDSSGTHVRPPSTGWEDDKSILYTSKPIPPSDPVTPWPVMPKPRPTAPRPTGPRVIVDVPKPVIPSKGSGSAGSGSAGSGSAGSGSGKPGSSSGGKRDRDTDKGVRGRTPSVTSTTNTSVYNKSAADRTALVIGLVAAILIIIVIVAPLIVFCKVRLRGAVGKGQLLSTMSSGDRTMYQPFVQPTTVNASFPFTPSAHAPTQPRLLPPSLTSASLGHGLLSTSTTGVYGQTGSTLYGHTGSTVYGQTGTTIYGQTGTGVYGTGGQGGYGTVSAAQSAPGTLPKKKDNREWYV